MKPIELHHQESLKGLHESELHGIVDPASAVSVEISKKLREHFSK
jgi:hypothetical protein